MEQKHLDWYIGKLGSIKKAGVKPQRTNYQEFFVALEYVAFDLLAFSDFSEKPRFGHVQQYYNTRKTDPNADAKRLFGIVNNIQMPDNATVNSDTIKNSPFYENVNSSWFLFYPYVSGAQARDTDLLIPEAVDNQNDTTCIIEKRLTPPESGSWENAVAVPVFSTVDSAKKDWLDTGRIARSKLVIVQPEGGQMSVLFCESKGAEPQHRTIDNPEFSENTHTFDEVPYVLMQRSLYVFLCNPNWDSPAEKEKRLLYRFQKICKNKGYLFKKKDLWNFHTSVKSGYLTILEGLSGTGKSSIVRLYKEAFGDNCKLCFLPVSPAWTDDAELLGYWDPRENEYVHTELLDFLLEAQEEINQRRLYLICLDEMNLARVEHYFYRILSVMEKPLGERTMLLHNDKEDADKCVCVEIGDNVRFVGTVNVDDTTFNFADKVRDRANIISLQVENYGDNPFGTSNNQQNNGAPCDTVMQAYFFGEFVRTYDDLSGEKEKNSREAQLRKFLWSLHETLCRDNRPFGVSPRTARAIGTYLANYPDNDGNTLNTEALDFQINQRILTKLHGSTELLEDLLKEYHPPVEDKEKASRELPNNENPQTPQVTEDEQKDADKEKTLDQLLYEQKLKTSGETLKRKRKELKTYGYCP